MATTAGHADWASWLDAQLRERGWSRADLARESGGKISSPQLSRWFKRTHGADPDAVRTVAAALDVPMLEAMVAAGHLTVEEAEVNVIHVGIDPEGLTNEALLRELGRRLGLLESLPDPQPQVSTEDDKPVQIAARKRREPRRFPDDPPKRPGPTT